ncbi:MAG: GNAT family N-acetyltransferase [Flavobacteriaceae bacterium]|nr:GNAT family N-acetyltransferase [Flavobacteriaceae bacterium]
MIRIVRTNSENQDFINLVKELDVYLKIVDGEDHDFYNQYNHIDVLQHAVVVYHNNIPVGCGAIKPFDASSMEVKRMYVKPNYRGRGIAQQITEELESWTKESGYQSTILETGKRQADAVCFYQKCKYQVIPNYGQYKGITNSVCFKKEL